jgi:hypothetical protein
MRWGVRRQALFAMLLSAIMLPVTGLGAARADPKSVMIVRGEDTLKLLTGNTLRSVGKKSIPDYRYFMNERFEYRCESGDLSNIGREKAKFYRESWGCEILTVSVKNGRLCEIYRHEPCQDDVFALAFRGRSNSIDARNGQMLGRVTVSRTGAKKADPLDYGLMAGDYDLIKGNATIFPAFDVAPEPEFVHSNAPGGPPVSIDVEGCIGERRLLTLRRGDAYSKIIGNTVILLDQSGKFDGRTGEYYDREGKVVVIKIPVASEKTGPPDPFADTAGSIYLNRWKIEKGEFCRTMNDEPAKFICGSPGVILQEPKQPGHQAAPRFCVGDSGIGPGFIAKGNAFAIEFGKPAGK